MLKGNLLKDMVNLAYEDCEYNFKNGENAEIVMTPTVIIRDNIGNVKRIISYDNMIISNENE